ncbi:MAG: tRNA (adenosine(37)-N6)-threonylcarbamoyltransferase complex ATPase subunit type 1 TsaE, partial [Clostridia bacterium]|nr:tRNA (adenosine(37)-N6)-threonylcarbamoyltransferase complex ATPase subunit type 1 TsaE [Clostridia bacterium]
FKSPKFSAAYVAKIAILTAISFILYEFVKFNLPFMFPSFLDMQISELPALLAGFSMGPISGCLVVVFKCLLKFPMSTTAYVGEATDILMGIALVLPASIIYNLKKDKKHALIGLLVGTAAFVVAGIIVNRFISIPFYVEFFFKGNFEILLNMVRPIYKNVTQTNFYTYYLLLGVLPFNLLRCIIISAVTFLLYKRLSVVLHWEGVSLRKTTDIYGVHKCSSIEDTYALASRVAMELDGGEVILLSGDLGAGKTTFTKGLAKALDIEDEITSPTFTILNTYEGGRLKLSDIKLNHLDMYRVESADELSELGIEDCFDDDAITVIEWNKFEHIDGTVIKIDITTDGDDRVFTISSPSDNATERISENI